MLIIKVTKEFEPVIDTFINSNNDIGVEKSRTKSFDGSSEIIALIIATVASPMVLNKIVSLIDTLITQYVEVQKENHRHEEEKIREANRHEEVLNKQNMNKITVIQKKDDFDVTVLLKLPDSNTDVETCRKNILEQLEFTNRTEKQE